MLREPRLQPSTHSLFVHVPFPRTARKAVPALGLLSAAILSALFIPTLSHAATLSITPFDSESLELHLPRNPLYYFYLRQSTDLQHFTPFSMVLGDQANTWTLFLEDIPSRFFTLRQISLFAPEDTDNDGIDDLYEIRHPVLNPLDPYDSLFDSGNNGLTYLQEYRAIYGLGTNPPEVYSREVSSFNFGAPIDAAISREVSLFNFGSPLFGVEALSREISVFNGQGVPTGEIAEVYSREVSAFNFGSPPSSIEAMSREISVFNGQGIPAGDIPEVYSREISTFNFGAASSPIEAISREVSVINTAP